MALPLWAKWWREFEPILVAGLELRVMVVWDGVTPQAVDNVVKNKRALPWKAHIEAIIVAADRVIRRSRADSDRSEAAGQ